MDRRFLTVLGVSLVFALIVSLIFYRLTGAGSGPRAAANTNTRDMVVAAKPLPIGVTIKLSDVKTVKFPIDQYPKGAYSKVEDVVDRPVVSPILIDEAVLDGRMAARGSGLGIAPTIPVGMRAVTVRVTDVAGVAGFVLPGLRVDVLVTGRPPSADSSITSTVLQNMLVLSAGQTLQPDQRGNAINAPTVTLLATPEQAELLTLAGNEGRIQLVLRNGSDQTIEKTPGHRTSDLYGIQRVSRKSDSSDDAPRRPRPRQVVVAPPPPPMPPPVVPPAPPEVVEIRGTSKTTGVVGQVKN